MRADREGLKGAQPLVQSDEGIVARGEAGAGATGGVSRRQRRTTPRPKRRGDCGTGERLGREPRREFLDAKGAQPLVQSDEGIVARHG